MRGRVEITNDSGGRGHDTGLRTFDCPLCGDRAGRGWMGVRGWGAGCFNVGCAAEPSLKGGAVEWARLVLGLKTRGEAFRRLAEEFGTDAQIVEWGLAPPPGPDFCRFPDGMRTFDPDGSVATSILESSFLHFAKRQWGISRADACWWELGWCTSGPHAWRIVIPIFMDGEPVGFQARATRGAEPKYVTSRHGPRTDPQAECARPAAAMLFNSDAIVRGEDVLLVEGAGDVMSLRGRKPAAVALLGVALTPAKLDLIKRRGPSRVIVALDAELEAQMRAAQHVEALRSWDVPAFVGEWTGGKDAGSGAHLVMRSDGSILADVERRLGSGSP